MKKAATKQTEKTLPAKKAISIYEAKTNFSKLVERAKAGETVVIGAYGKEEVKLVPVKKKNKIQFGTLAHMYPPIDDKALRESEPEIIAMSGLNDGVEW